MIDAIKEAKRLQHNVASTTMVPLSLDVLERLLDRIEELTAAVANYEAAYPEANFVRMQPRLVVNDEG
jgi:hypothetical protein